MSRDADYDTGAYHCTVCGKDLTDPKNSGDPDLNGEWVCQSISCRAAHPVGMTCEVKTRG